MKDLIYDPYVSGILSGVMVSLISATFSRVIGIDGGRHTYRVAQIQSQPNTYVPVMIIGRPFVWIACVTGITFLVTYSTFLDIVNNSEQMNETGSGVVFFVLVWIFTITLLANYLKDYLLAFTNIKRNSILGSTLGFGIGVAFGILMATLSPEIESLIDKILSFLFGFVFIYLTTFVIGWTISFFSTLFERRPRRYTFPLMVLFTVLSIWLHLFDGWKTLVAL